MVNIPSQAKPEAIPSTFCVPAFPCEEMDGYIWVWLGDPRKKTDVPLIPEFREGKWFQGSRVIKCDFLRALEITFDGAHVYFAHPTHPATIASKKNGMEPIPSEIRITKTGCVTFAPATTRSEDPIPSSSSKMEFILPGQIRFEMPSATGRSALAMIFLTTPLSKGLCRMDWLIANAGYFDTPERVLWTGEGRDVIEEDQRILEAIQKTYELEGEAFERSVEADIPSLTLRKIVRLREAGEWSPETFPLATRRLFTSQVPTRF